MKYKHPFITSLTKIIGSIMTIIFSLIAFAHGQTCHLLPGWTPSTLADGQSRTGYQVNQATYTQSCTGSAGIITCISGTVDNGNIFKYPSCIPHTWANCTSPTIANHLDYKTLYTLWTATYTQTCQQLSQNLQCLDGHFTWWTTPNLYTHATCVDPNRAQCIDIRTNGYRDHGETIIWYAATHPSFGQTCSTLQKTLTCTNGTWSWGNQSSLFTWCTDPWAFSWCVNIRTNASVPHGSALSAYTSPVSIGTGTCNNLVQTLTCTNGLRAGGSQSSLFSGCTQSNSAPCPNIITNSWTLSHGTFITEYIHPFAYETSNQYCIDFIKTLQCVNGTRSWLVWGLHTSCQNVSSWSCLSAGVYTPNFQSITRYTHATATTTQSCETLQKTYTCVNSIRSGGTPTWFTGCWWCILPRWGTVSEWRWGFGYSTTWAIFPKACTDFSTALSCSWGILNGNRQTYQYSTCMVIGWLTAGVDLAIDGSSWLPGSQNISGNLVAQWSNPEIAIVFQNKWDTAANWPINAPWFLSCTRAENGTQVYTSNPITSFSVNPWTKVGVNIRISTWFTDDLGVKTMICKINPSMLANSVGDVSSNNSRSGKFEVVKADRFDLALNRSIQSISNNIDAAEWAKWTQGLQNFLFDKIMNILVPLVIVIGILSAILGFYKIMFSSEDSATKEWTRYLIYWVVGIVVIMSAKFIGQNMYSILNPVSGEIKWFEIARDLYGNIIYPFIKFAIYLVLGAMFIILVSRVITFLFGTDADAQKKAGTLIGRNVISMLIIIWAKQIVEAVYGKQAVVVKDITNLWEVWSGVLADKNIPILYQVINYALGIASLVILVVIIIQTIKLLMKPDDPAQIKSIKNSLFYMLIGILILWAWYLIVNFAIIN